MELKAAIAELTEAEALAILHDWPTWARPDQLAPESDWDVWLIMTGRGWGKTRTAAQQVCAWAEAGNDPYIHLVARTAADARDTMVEGESGILAISHPSRRPVYEPSKRRITWPNGTKATLFSAEEPDALRGPQCYKWWADEVASWKYMQDTWDMLQFGARLGAHPQGIVTTTPRPVRVLKDLVKRVESGRVVMTRGHTRDNAQNLAPQFMAQILDRYAGTRLGRQELDGEILDDNPRALWRRAWIDAARVDKAPDGYQRVVVAVDPGIKSKEGSDATGIVVCGKDWRGQYYVVDDCTMIGTPREWALAVSAAYKRHQADRIVAEVNQGGEMVEHVIQSVDASLPVKMVHASRGKQLRAEPVSALAEQGKIHHVGFLGLLEDELCEWDPADANAPSPNRLDACVYGITELMGGEGFADGGWDVGPG